jgi:inner membrane transporter RhtA
MNSTSLRFMIATMSHAPALVNRTVRSVPPQAWFGISAVFHYLGPSFAVLLFPAVGVLGVAWLRIASAALVFAPITRPWRLVAQVDSHERWLLLIWGTSLALMNVSFYIALSRLPIGLVATIEFLGPVSLALYGFRTTRNFAALALAVIGTFILVKVRWSTDYVGVLWAFLDAALFIVYIVVGHRVAASGAGSGIERLGAAMAIALVIVFPIGLMQAVKTFGSPLLLLAGAGVGICSSVIPYVCDQIVMARVSRAAFALLTALLPAYAVIIGAIVLKQWPSVRDLVGIALVMGGVALHRPGEDA